MSVDDDMFDIDDLIKKQKDKYIKECWENHVKYVRALEKEKKEFDKLVNAYEDFMEVAICKWPGLAKHILNSINSAKKVKRKMAFRYIESLVDNPDAMRKK